MSYSMYAFNLPAPTADDASKRSRYCFEINNYGMRFIRQVMYALDLLVDCPLPEMPTFPGAEHFNEFGEPTTPEGSKYRDAYWEAMRFSPGGGRVPLHKFCSNDGWVVTAEECAALAVRLCHLSREEYEQRMGSSLQSLEDLALLREFGEFAARCTYTDGFEVY